MRFNAAAYIVGGLVGYIPTFLGGSVCDPAVFNGAEFYQNLVVGAVVDVVSMDAITDSTKAPLVARAAFYAANTGMSLTSTPTKNNFLSTTFGAENSCGQCANVFFGGVVDKLKAIRFAASPQDKTTAAAFPCGGIANVDNTQSISYGHSYAAYTAWSSLDGNSLEILSADACVSVIQEEIDTFNFCVKNEYDVLTGAATPKCGDETFFDFQVQFPVYKIIMNAVLGNPGTPDFSVTTGFADAYSSLSCARCFDLFIAEIAAKADTLTPVGGGPCGAPNSSPFSLYGTNTNQCLDPSGVLVPLVDVFNICTGQTLYTKPAYHASADEQFFYNDALRMYAAVTNCGAAYNSDTDRANWLNCMDNSNVLYWSPLLNIDATVGDLNPSVSSFGKCIESFAHDVYLDSNSRDKCKGYNNLFEGYDCMSILESHVPNPYDEFAYCAGFPLNITRPTCGPDNYGAIPQYYKTYVPYLEIALAASDPVTAAKHVMDVLEHVSEDMYLYLEHIPCFYCFARFAAEINLTFGPTDKTKCTNMYSSDCKTDSAMVSALTRFSACYGSSLTPGITCDANEITALRTHQFSRSIISVAAAGGSAQFMADAYARVFKSITDVENYFFACQVCYNRAFLRLQSVGSELLHYCVPNVYSDECASVAEIQDIFAEFKRCAGYDFDLIVPCDAEEFTDIDATYVAYQQMMQFALISEPLDEGFANAYSNTDCRTCFDNFMSSVRANAATILTGTDCGTSTDLDLFANACLSDVNTAKTTFESCVGNGAVLITTEPFHPTADQQFLLNEIVPIYQALATCGHLTDPAVDNAHLVTWNSCMEGFSPLLDIVSQFPAGGNFGACLKGFATAVFARGNPCQPSNGVFSDACINDLETNLVFLHFYQCAGFEMNAAPTTCSPQNITSIPAVFKTYPNIVQLAMSSDSEVEAAKYVLRMTDLMSAVNGLACSSCYAALAAELKAVLTDEYLALCVNPYDDVCGESAVVAAALERFNTCAGFELTNKSADTCSSAEWTVVQTAQLPLAAFNLLVSPNSDSLLQILFKFKAAMESLKTSNPTLVFRCSKCFQTLIEDLSKLTLPALTICQTDISSAACMQAGADIPMKKFTACSGHEFDFSIPSVEEASTTIAPTTSAETTTILPTTSKSAEPYFGIILTSMPVLIALSML